MAILLIMDRNNFNLDVAKDASGCYKLGDIVEVLDDNKAVVLPPAEPFYIVRVSGLSLADARKYMEPQYDTTDAARLVMTMRRLYNIPVDLLPQETKETLQKERYLEADWKTVSEYLTNKSTLDTAAGEALVK